MTSGTSTINPRQIGPTYRAGSRTYRIDDCSIQLKAIQAGRVEFHGYSTGWYPGTPIDAQTLSGITSIGTLDTVGWQEWGLKPHRNEGIEICYLEAGSTVFHVSRRHFALEADTITITRPWQLHSLGNPTIGHCRLHWFILDVGVRAPRQRWTWPEWIILSKPDLAELSALLSDNRSPVVKSTSDLAHSFRQIAAALSGDDPGRFSRMAIYINAVLSGLLHALRSNTKGSRRTDALSRHARVQEFLSRLASRPDMLAEPWTLDRMASACDMRSTAFVKYCRAVTNQSPVDFLIEARLDQAARQLLEAPDLSITDIAMACGFSSSQYFATQFKKHTSMTPRAWRNAREPGISAPSNHHRPA